MSGKLKELANTVATASPQVVDAWEATALIESLGYTDHRIQEEFGFSNTLVAGQNVYARLSREQRFHRQTLPDREPPALVRFLDKFSSSFVYAVPWLVAFISESQSPHALEVSPELAGPLNLALMASLITSGGFIQVIARRGQFYLGLKDPALARRICVFFIRVGIAAALLFCLLGLFIGLYSGRFRSEGLIVGAFYYLVLSLLWMVCATLSIQKHAWRIPTVFLAGGLLFALLRVGVGVNTLAAQMASALATLLTATALSAYDFGGVRATTKERVQLPRMPVLLHSLAPYFCYGVAYFSFLFADRLAAGSAVPSTSGLGFGVDPEYKQGMDVALINFLFIVALVECISDGFMHYWCKQARVVTQDGLASFERCLRHRYVGCILAIGALSALSGTAIWILLGRLRPSTAGTPMLYIALAGSLGYLLLSIGFFNSIVLFSLNRPAPVLRSIAPGLLLNATAGYCLSHLLGANFAVAGLLLGGAIFALRSTYAVQQALAQPDYAYVAA